MLVSRVLQWLVSIATVVGRQSAAVVGMIQARVLQWFVSSAAVYRNLVRVENISYRFNFVQLPLYDFFNMNFCYSFFWSFK